MLWLTDFHAQKRKEQSVLVEYFIRSATINVTVKIAVATEKR
jgi:hypothetical protein